MILVIVYYFGHLHFLPSTDQGYLIGWLTYAKIVISSFKVASDGGIGSLSLREPKIRHVIRARVNATHLLLVVFRRESGFIRMFVLELLNSRTFEFTFFCREERGRSQNILVEGLFSKQGFGYDLP